MTTQLAWYSYPRIDNFGQIDPQGNYWKPDSNIMTPPGYPVTSLYSGTVTSVQRTSWGQTVVTMKMDNPINALATHTFYEHMHDSTVQIGQRVQAGDLIGHANYLGEGANLGVGFYSGDVYGSGTAWNTLQNDLKPGGAGLLNPSKILGSLEGGNTSVLQTGTTQPTTSCGQWDIGCMIKTAGEAIAIFLIALVMIILGFYLLAEKQVTGLAKKAIA